MNAPDGKKAVLFGCEKRCFRRKVEEFILNAVGRDRRDDREFMTFIRVKRQTAHLRVKPGFALAAGEQEGAEGCLSVPGVYAEVTRPSKIKVEYYNENLEKVVEEFDRFACRMVQHELSHLEGNLFVDNISPIRRKMIARKLQAISKGSVQTRYKSKR